MIALNSERTIEVTTAFETAKQNLDANHNSTNAEEFNKALNDLIQNIIATQGLKAADQFVGQLIKGYAEIILSPNSEQKEINAANATAVQCHEQRKGIETLRSQVEDQNRRTNAASPLCL